LPSEARLRKQRKRAKEVRKEVRRRERNRMIRSEARTMVTAARAALEADDRKAIEATLAQALVRLDSAATSGVVHKNNAARRKSRLMAAFHAKYPGAPTPSAEAG
jgi:small subunit ribosomal protein S20